ncbi:MAG: Ig-like domain-containing protein [Acholeplasmatales bacterium]
MRKRFVFFFLIFFAALVLTSCKETGEISLADPVINLKVGESKKINYEITKGHEVEFLLPNENVAKISGDNIVGVSAGEVVLTATIKGTEISATATVKVTNVEAESVTIAGDASGLVGAQIQLTATVLPANTTDKTVTWSSSDETIATVDQTGKVSLLKVGQATIKAKVGTKEKTHAITVNPILAESVTIAGDTSGLVGAQIQLTATVLPENTTDKTVTWSSSDETIATVDQTGKVSLLKVGQATIKAKVGTKEKTHVITVNPILAESVTIAGATSGLVGAHIQLTATVLPANTTDKTVTWSSSDETIATVDQTGKVSLLKVGQATIKAKVGTKEKTHVITVNPILAESVTIAGDTSGFVGAQIQLTATVLPENTTDKTVTWSSSDETKATVDQTGKVSLLKVG